MAFECSGFRFQAGAKKANANGRACAKPSALFIRRHPETCRRPRRDVDCWARTCVAPASGERTRPRVRPLAPSPKASSRAIASECEFRGAHPSRVLAEASRLGELCAWSRRNARGRLEVRVGGTPTPTRETRALPGVPITCRLIKTSGSPREIPLTDSGQALRRLPMNLPVGDRRSAPTARPQCSLVCCNTITFALQEWRWSRVGLPISASASWSAGSPLPLSQAGESPAYGRFPLPSELSASLRQRMLPLELTPDVARRTAKAVEDYPHSKTLTRLPSPSRSFALCHRLAIRTGHCYSLLGLYPWLHRGCAVGAESAAPNH